MPARIFLLHKHNVSTDYFGLMNMNERVKFSQQTKVCTAQLLRKSLNFYKSKKLSKQLNQVTQELQSVHDLSITSATNKQKLVYSRSFSTFNATNRTKQNQSCSASSILAFYWSKNLSRCTWFSLRFRFSLRGLLSLVL